MCITCRSAALPRRRFLALAATATAAAGLGAGFGLGSTPAAAAGGHGHATELTADQALEKLAQGNARFVANAEVCAADLTGQRSHVAGNQAPWATVVSCADSRLPPELVFGGLGLGELFVARNAGNLVDTAVLGTVEYGAAMLGSPLLVIMGHQRCGAVAAACEVVTKNVSLPGAIGTMIEPILPAALAVKDAPGDFVTNTVRESARRTAAHLTERSAVLAGLVKDAKLKIVSAYYDLDSGKVDFVPA
jgi:carbonic anhydrase